MSEMPLDRLLAVVPHWSNRITVTPEKGCWEWTGSINSSGYASARVRKLLPNEGMAHRISYAILRGNLVSGMVLDHLCRVRHCLNPEHLEMVTPQENLRRGRTSEKEALWTKLMPGVEKPHNWEYYCVRLHVLAGHKYIMPEEFFNGYVSQVCESCLIEKRQLAYSKSPTYTGRTRRYSKRAEPDRVSGYKGICWDKAMGRWKISLWHERRGWHGGYYRNLEDAVEELPKFKLKIGKN